MFYVVSRSVVYYKRFLNTVVRYTANEQFHFG